MKHEFPAAVPEIPVTDMNEALNYYEDKLGFNVDWGGADGGIAGISKGHCRMFLTDHNFRQHHGNAAPVMIWLNLNSKEEVDELHEIWNAGGARIISPPESWLSDKTKLQRLSQMTKVRRIQQQLDSYLGNWDYETLTISIDNHGSSRTRFHARLAQYEFHSMKALKEKITQFPSGTKFFLSILPQESPSNDQINLVAVVWLDATNHLREATREIPWAFRTAVANLLTRFLGRSLLSDTAALCEKR